MKNVISVVLLVVTFSVSIAQESQNKRGNYDRNDQQHGDHRRRNSVGGIQIGTQSSVQPLDAVKYPHPGANKNDTTFTVEYFEKSEQCIDIYSMDAKDINAEVRQFALDLLTDIVVLKPRENIIISTFSVWSALLVMLEGSAGETAKQIEKMLKLPSNEQHVRCMYLKLASALKNASLNNRDITFENKHAIFTDHNTPSKHDFEQIITTYYNCVVVPLVFSRPVFAANKVNGWVKNNTRGRITQLITKDDIQAPGFIIANTVYFKGRWKSPFNLSATFSDKFFNEQREEISTVQMMYQKAEFLYSFMAEINSHVLDMPYADNSFRMLIVLPKVNTKLDDALKKMKLFPVDACYDRLVREQEMYSDSAVHVYLPRFKSKTTVELSSYLKRRGIVDLFDSGSANLSKISDSASHLSKMIHIAEIEVNEEGSVASAATGGVFVNRGAPPKFIANRPFAYFIVEETQKSVIFAGKVYNPNANN